MRILWMVLLASSFFAMGTATSSARDVETVTDTVDAQGARKLNIDCEFGVGRLTIAPADIAAAAILTVTYDPRRFDYHIDYRLRGDVGILDLESDAKHGRHNDDSDNEWNLVLSTRYSSELDLEIGAAEAEVDLGGIPLTDAKIEMGAAKGTVDFSKPNPARLEELKIDVGAASGKILNLGNANFDYLDFSGGVAASTLDFRGDFHGESRASIEVGIGSADIILPKGLAVRIKGDEGFFNSIDFHGGDLNERRDGVHETDDFADAKDRLTIDLDVSMGSIDVYFK